MSDDTPKIDVKELEEMNEKAIRNQFFTPDQVYLDLSLMKDIPLGLVYRDQMEKGPESFAKVQAHVLSVVEDYQKRTYDTVDPYLSAIGYSDQAIADLLVKYPQHDAVFALAPTTKFFNMLIRHTIRNQNNSRPANKYNKKMLTKDTYVVEPVQVTYHINTYPLNLSRSLLEKLGAELGESLGVNIKFHNKAVARFDQSDWDTWMKSIDCFYLNSLGEFTRNPFLSKRQEEFEFVGRFFFARKRFEKCVMIAMQGEDFDQQIQITTATLDMFCDFAWLQNNDTRLTEQGEDVPFDEPQNEMEAGT